MIFAAFDVLLAVNMCINYSFLYIYLQYQPLYQLLSLKRVITSPIAGSARRSKILY